MKMESDNPILNGPYDEPGLHYATDLEGALDYSQVVKGRRIFMPGIVSMPSQQGGQKSLLDANDMGANYGSHLVNQLRTQVADWRKAEYPGVTRVTQELLRFWFLNPDRIPEKRLFFAQRVAVRVISQFGEEAMKVLGGDVCQLNSN